MFKKYREMAVGSSNALQKLACERAGRYIEKQVFTTLQTLESKHIVTREDELKCELEAELAQERTL